MAKSAFISNERYVISFREFSFRHEFNKLGCFGNPDQADTKDAVRASHFSHRSPSDLFESFGIRFFVVVPVIPVLMDTSSQVDAQ